MRILLHSNGPGTSAYGRQAAIWARALPQLGHEVAISAFAGLLGATRAIDGITVYPGGIELYGGDVLAGHAADFGADLVITLMDVWALTAGQLKSLGVPVACWLPVDCAPLSLKDIGALRGSGAAVIALSRHGQEQLKEAGFESLYVPHGIDTAVFAPGDKAAAREALGVPSDAYVIGMNAANLDALRKGFGEQFAAFAMFRREHPEALLMVHTLADRRGQGGLNLTIMARRLGIEDAVWFADPYRYTSGGYSDTDMATWYACLDVYSGCSWAEGFGIPLIEAQSCGIPVVTTRASAMTENCGCGWLVDGDLWWNDPHAAWWAKPRIQGIAEAYERAYGGEGEPEKAREFAERFDIQRVLTEYWKPALDQLEAAMCGDDAPGMTAEAAGLKWHVSDIADNMGPSHEDSVEANLLGLLKPGDVFLDVGAHVGHYALRAASTASKVIAVEASPDTAERLRANVKLNGITNVTLHNAAAWDCYMQMRLDSPNGLVRDGSMRVLPGDGPVQAMPLDALLAAEPRVDLVKLDVEGADLHALRGMRETITRCRPVLFIEDHSIYGYYQRADLDALISELGYVQRDGGAYGGATYIIAEPVPRKVAV